ncbi:MAG TPA: EamA family transporter [Anaerolineaceae bacterium]|uniref:Putative membrane protein n=1 Tax=Anaerolinea thermophila TaxID=167964 RepID=A0A124FN86_9CHLR|nr:MAG: putative membrane protein [Anaerolinea thermophila]HAF61085.1 EamA family transporter [Anaerolineaceae bacterium]
MRTLNKSTLMLFIGILAVSTASIFIRNAQITLPSTVIAAGRLAFATIILAPFSAKKAIRDYSELDRSKKIRIMLAGVFLGIHFLVWIRSLEMTSIASSVILVTTTPIWVALLSPLLLKEKVARGVAVGLIVAMLGIVILFWGPSSDSGQQLSTQSLSGNLLALCGAWMAAAYTMIGRDVRNAIPLRSYVFMVYGIAAVVAILFSIPDLQTIQEFSMEGLFWVLLLALIPQVIGHTLFNRAVRQMPVVYASIALLGEPIGSIILAWLFLAEKPGPFDLAGGIFVIVGILLAFLDKREIADQSLE